MSVNQDAVFNAEEIRDTNTHTSSQVYNGDMVIKSLIVENGHNQTGTFQCEGSAHSDFSNPFLIGSSWDVSANTNSLQTCDSYIPYWRIKVSYASAPSSGSLSVVVLGVSS